MWTTDKTFICNNLAFQRTMAVCVNGHFETTTNRFFTPPTSALQAFALADSTLTFSAVPDTTPADCAAYYLSTAVRPSSIEIPRRLSMFSIQASMLRPDVQ